MNKKYVARKEFADRMAAKTGEFKYRAMDMLDAFQEVLEEAMINGESVYLKDFAIFDVVDRTQRDYSDPKTQKTVKGYPRKKVRTRFCGRLQKILDEQAKGEDAK